MDKTKGGMGMGSREGGGEGWGQGEWWGRGGGKCRQLYLNIKKEKKIRKPNFNQEPCPLN